MKKLLATVIMVAMVCVAGCTEEAATKDPSRQEKAWEDGVFWGASVTRRGSSASSALEDAYKARQVAGEQVKAQDERLKALRNRVSTTNTTLPIFSSTTIDCQ